LTRRLSALPALVLFLCVAGIYAAGAHSTDPGTGVAAFDFTVVRHWQKTGKLEDHPSGAHLTKPGYLAYLRVTAPSAGESPAENRRFLFLNALWICLGLGLGAWALSRVRSVWIAAGFLAYGLLHTSLRDSADYFASEPLSAGAGLAFLASLIALRKPRAAAWGLIGAGAALLYLLRPNLGALCFALAAALVLARPFPKRTALAALLSGAAIAVVLLVGLAAVTRQGMRPLRSDTSKALLWGTADYYWGPDLGPWPQGSAPDRTRIELERTGDRWRGLLKSLPRSSDAIRSLTWRATHLLLSSEQLPPRWSARSWVLLDAASRQLWWCAAILGACAAVAAAIGGRGEWRWAPVLILGALIAQALAFGSDPRLALPLIPLLALSLAAALPLVRWSRWSVAGAALTALLFLAALRLVPDSANSDFALVRGPGRVIEQVIPGAKVPDWESVVFHARLLEPEGLRIGWEVSANGRVVATKAADGAPSRAFLTFALSRPELSEIRRTGLVLRIRTTGDASSGDAYVYYPIAPGVLDGVSRVDGDERLPSLWSSGIRGGIPIWWHAGKAD